MCSLGGHSWLNCCSLCKVIQRWTLDVTTPNSTMADNSNNGDSAHVADTNQLNTTLKLVLNQLKEQKEDLNSLRNDVKGSTVSVTAEVKSLKEKELSWKWEGNKIQYNFNSEIQQDCAQAAWAITNSKLDYAHELLNECQEKIKRRNKLIRIADTSEAGWDTVKLYESNPIASDSDDESRINKAENRALRKRKLALSKKDGKAKSARNNSVGMSVAATPYSLLSQWGVSPLVPGAGPQPGPSAMSNFRGFTTKRPTGCCFACGEFSHYRRDCPYTTPYSSSKTIPRNEAAPKKP